MKESFFLGVLTASELTMKDLIFNTLLISLGIAPYAIALIAIPYSGYKSIARSIRGERRRARDDVARAIAAFPCYWTSDRIGRRPGWTLENMLISIPPM